nr:hypothetical protein [uncultured Acetatifactor sp.]
MKRKPKNRLPVLLALAMALCQSKAYAVGEASESVDENVMEKVTESAPENITVPTESSDIISVALPMVEERDPFSFFIDPLHIFYNTFGNSGGDITVEEETYLLFYNRDEGGYTLSSRSDSLEVINKSTVPVQVTITAKLENADEIFIMQEREFGDRNSCDLYLALVDSEGNEQPLSEGGEVSVTVRLDRAPLDAYAYVLCDETGEYQYVCQSGNVAFDTYSFGLMGACNEKGDWTAIGGRPHVIISWNVEPVISDESEAGEASDEIIRDILENSVSDDVLPDENEQSMGEPGADGDDELPEDSASSESTDVDTEGSASENDGSDGKDITEDNDTDSESSSAEKEEKPDNDSSAEESSVTDDNVPDKEEESTGEQVTDSGGEPSEDGTEETGDSTPENDGSDEKGTTEDSVPDSNSNGADKEEVSDNDSSAEESSVTESDKSEATTLGEEQL